MVVILDNKWVGKVAVVTGASSGIGKAIAERLVEEGMKVVGLARSKQKLHSLAESLSSKKGGKLYIFQTDVSKEDAILMAFAWIRHNVGPIHVLINNAAVANLGLISESDTKNWTEIFQVNVIGLCIATREALKSMKENNIDGHIININSFLGHTIPTFQNANMYPASKHANRVIAEMLRNELAHLEKRIKVTTLSPGLTNTPMADNVREKIQEFSQGDNDVALLEPKNIAETVVFVISTPPTVQITELIVRPLGETC
ncbi:farnesol dehydrogenase-like [Diabrotica virgifera virgifera]|uniref:Farnesol dehydrogenase-like n=1 Tax=Diabrotica virgifera virgifera TaxID=50390 RepID=A0ABM5IRX8_DIAVI|nr:farnesol dehydrogenase-like [Diabrotica virgifera virgifera]